MAKQTISIGAAANDGLGDPLRTAMDKTNDNFNEVYNAAVEPTYFYFNGRMARIGYRDDAVVIDKSLAGSWGTEDVDWVELTSFDNI